MSTNNDIFNDIRPYLDSEVPDAIAQLIADKNFRMVVEPLVKPHTWEQFSALLMQCKSKDDFQNIAVYPIMRRLINKTTTEMNGSNWENIDISKGRFFISNHRDIVLDAAFRSEERRVGKECRSRCSMDMYRKKSNEKK